jgi:hypothetical protein
VRAAQGEEDIDGAPLDDAAPATSSFTTVQPAQAKPVTPPPAQPARVEEDIDGEPLDGEPMDAE